MVHAVELWGGRPSQASNLTLQDFNLLLQCLVFRAEALTLTLHALDARALGADIAASWRGDAQHRRASGSGAAGVS
jgi:hypothetical protein